MTGFDSKRQASKSLLEPQSAKDVAAEQAEDEGLWFASITASEAYLQAALRRLSAAVEGTQVANTWRDAIDAQLVCLHLGTAESFPDPKFALDLLISWHIATALDPEVSASAKLLVDRGRAAVADEKRDRQHPLNAGNLLEIKPNGKRTERSYQSTGREGQDSSSPRSSALHASSPESGACAAGQEADGNVSKRQAPVGLVPAPAVADDSGCLACVTCGQPAVAEPLTEEEIATIAEFAYGFASRNAEFRIRFARAIEAAHGIGIKRSAA